MIEIGYVLAGLLTGFCVGLTGVGGGALMTPILLLILQVDTQTAIATDLWFAAITKLFGASSHHASGNVDWQVVRRLWVGSIPVAMATALVIGAGGGAAKNIQLTYAVGAALIVTACGMLVAPKLMLVARATRIAAPVGFKAIQPVATTIAGVVLGLFVALTSIGAGALGSLMLVVLYPLRMTPHRLVATDIIHAIPLAVVAGTGYLIGGLVDWKMLSLLLAGSIPAVIIGSRLAGVISGRMVQIALAIVLMVVGAKVVIELPLSM